MTAHPLSTTCHCLRHLIQASTKDIGIAPFCYDSKPISRYTDAPVGVSNALFHFLPSSHSRDCRLLLDQLAPPECSLIFSSSSAFFSCRAQYAAMMVSVPDSVSVTNQGLAKSVEFLCSVQSTFPAPYVCLDPRLGTKTASAVREHIITCP